MPRVKELQDMEIDEISLVDRPAAQHAKVVIAKRATEEETVPEEIYNEDGELLETELLEEGDVVFDEDGQAYVVVDEESEFDPEMEEVGKAIGFKGVGQMKDAAFKAAPSFRARAAGANLKRKAGERYLNPKMSFKGTGDMKGTTLKQRGRDRVKWGNASKDAAIGAAVTSAGGAAAYGAHKKVQKSFADELREELSKSYTDADRDEVIAKAMGQVDDMAASLAEAEEIAKSERDLRLTREYEEVAKTYNLPVEPSELAPVLMAIAETLPYEYGEVIHKALSAAGEILFEEVGTQGYASNNDVLTSVDAYIDENIAKADISKAQAVEAVFAENPNAYDEYMATRYGS